MVIPFIETDSNNIITWEQLLYIYLTIFLPLAVLSWASWAQIKWKPISSQNNEIFKNVWVVFFITIILLTLLGPFLAGLFFVPHSGVTRLPLLVKIRDSLHILDTKTKSGVKWKAGEQWTLNMKNRSLYKENRSLELIFPNHMPTIDKDTIYAYPTNESIKSDWEALPFRYIGRIFFYLIVYILFDLSLFEKEKQVCYRCRVMTNFCQRLLYKVNNSSLVP